MLFAELFIMIAICLSGLFVSEKTSGMQELIGATVKGKNKIRRIKTGIALSIYTFLFLCIFGERIAAINQIYGFPSLDANTGSLIFMRWNWTCLSILNLLCFVHFTYYIMGLIFVTVTLEISKKSQSRVTAIMMSLFVCILFVGICYVTI